MRPDRMVLLWSLALISLLVPGLVWGFSADVIGTEVAVTYGEPQTNENGSPLVDLHHTTIYYDKGAGPMKAAEVQATQMTGGGTITQRITIPATEKAEFEVKLWATASDITGNESQRSNEVMRRIDRLPPAAPR